MNVKQIIIEHLKSIGADGLCTDDCGCGIDDLAPCEQWCPDCVPARKTIADEAGEFHDIGDTIYVPLEPGDPDGPNDKTAPLREDLRKAIALLREGKRRFAPNTTNSTVDDFLAKFDQPSDGREET